MKQFLQGLLVVWCWKDRDPDGVITLYTNNVLGERAVTATDYNRDDDIDFSELEDHDRD